MQQYDFPTIIYCGEGALDTLALELSRRGHRKALVVSDKGLWDLGLLDKVIFKLQSSHMEFTAFHDIHPNPLEEDVLGGVACYRENDCDCIVALGGGSPIDVAKAIKIMVSHEGPLGQYDDAQGGDAKIVNPMPALYAIPTTAGTGSEVGRSSVIILKETGRKTIFFHPSLIPDIAVLEPSLTVDLPPLLTAATGLDAFTHNLEAYLAPVDHPMADGIALMGLRIILEFLPRAVHDGHDLLAREKMMLAASMGATAFQKGLGMTHSMAHPLSEKYNLHHGLANALLLPHVIKFLEGHSELDSAGAQKMDDLKYLVEHQGWYSPTLSHDLEEFISTLGITLGLKNHGVPQADLDSLAQMAVGDPCHATNVIPVTQADFLKVFTASWQA